MDTRQETLEATSAAEARVESPPPELALPEPPLEPPTKPRRRRSIVIEPSMQWPAALAVGAIVAAGVVMISVARYLQTGANETDFTGERIARLTVLWNGLLVVFVIAAVVTYVLNLTHKV